MKKMKHTYKSTKKGSFKVQGGFYTEKAMKDELHYDKLHS